MVIRRRAEKPNTLRPLRSAFEVLFDDVRDHGIVILRTILIAYVVLALVALPLTAASLIPIYKGSSFASNVVYIFNELVRFLKGTDIVVPGAGDYLLAGIVLLYHRTLRAPIAFLLGAGAMYLLTNYGLEPVASYFYSANSSGNSAAFPLQYAYTALLLGIEVCSIFLPTIVASRLKRATWVKYFFVNGLIGWFPPIWVLLLFLAFKPPRATAVSSEEEKTVGVEPAEPVSIAESESAKSLPTQKAAPPQRKERKNKKGFRKR